MGATSTKNIQLIFSFTDLLNDNHLGKAYLQSPLFKRKIWIFKNYTHILLMSQRKWGSLIDVWGKQILLHCGIVKENVNSSKIAKLKEALK